MIKLDQLKRKMRVNGIVPEQTVELVDVEQSGPSSVSVAYRIHLGYLFNPLLAVHTSLIKALPYQITATHCGPDGGGGGSGFGVLGGSCVSAILTQGMFERGLPLHSC